MRSVSRRTAAADSFSREGSIAGFVWASEGNGRKVTWAMEAVPDEASIYKIRREEKRI
jgi:hypothetical protein